MGNVAAIIAAATALAALAGGYVQFVLRRALHPCIELDVEVLVLNRPGTDQLVGEVLCRVRNEGPGVGFVTNVRCRIRYGLVGESEVRQDEPSFTHRLPAEGFFYLDQEKRFIQPGVTQHYRKPLVLPADTCLIHVWGRFDYDLGVGRVTTLLADLFRQPRGPNPTTYAIRRTFAISDDR
jgi:hypothetical protein